MATEVKEAPVELKELKEAWETKASREEGKANGEPPGDAASLAAEVRCGELEGLRTRPDPGKCMGRVSGPDKSTSLRTGSSQSRLHHRSNQAEIPETLRSFLLGALNHTSGGQIAGG